MDDQQNKTKNRTGLNILFGVLFVVLAAAIIYLYTELTGERKDAAEMKVTLELQKDNLTKELTELNSSFNIMALKIIFLNLLGHHYRSLITAY